jgi:hypothetical protein
MELEMDMELSGSSGSRHFDGLLGFTDVDEGRREQKPQHGSLDIQPADDGKQQQNNQLSVNSKKQYHQHTAHQMEA